MPTREDNFAIAYLCKGLDGYMRNYQKKYYGLSINCRKKYSRCGCGSLYVKIVEKKLKNIGLKYVCKN